MSLLDEHFDSTEDVSEEYPSSSQEALEHPAEEVDAYLYLLDLVAALNNLSETAAVVTSMLTPEQSGIALPHTVEKVFSLFREKDQFLQSLQMSLEKMELFKAAVEGALLSTAAIEFTKRTFKEASS